MLDLAGYAVRAAFEKAVRGFPVLRCVEASTVLHFLLRALGYPARLVKGSFQLDKPLPKSFEPADGRYLTYAHHWVEVEDTVLDITGDQFDPALQRPWVPVYIGSRADRYVDGVEDDQNEILEHPICQAVLFELRQLLPGWIPVEGPTGGLDAGDFIWWDGRNPADQKAFETHLKNLGKAVEERLTNMTFRRPEIRIGQDDTYAWITWAPPEYGDNVEYRYRPHFTLDVKPNELVLHLNLEMVDNARHFARLVLADPVGVLRLIRELDCGLELQVYQCRREKLKDWRPEQPVYYQVLDLTPDELREAVENSQRWGEHEGTLPAYLLSKHMPAARAIALAGKLPDLLACWMERLRPGLEHFDRKRR